jgi:hypothetical protein
MTRTLYPAFAMLMMLASAFLTGGAKAPTTNFRLNSIEGLEVVGARAEVTTYRGSRAVRLVPLPDHQKSNDTMLAMLKTTDFKDGVIEADVAGSPREGAPADARGFIGIAFRVQPLGARYECFYIRPTNGRADDQLRRNHSTQYVSEPDYPWYRLREEKPGVYESYTDLESGVWTRIKIVVSGIRAQLYINGAANPSLIVNDLKLGESRGQIALWADWSTDAYFSNLAVK